MLKLTNFSFSLGQRKILDSLDFHLASGDYLSIIGPNGAGKSTMLKCLMRLHERGSHQGDIEVNGINLVDYGQRRLARTISYVPQAGGWIPPFTVSELLRLSRFPYGNMAGSLKNEDLEAIRKALEMTELDKLSERHLRELSGGERQRAFLAAALAQDTKIMLLDEPASFLDPKHASYLNSLLRRLNQEYSLTMLTVTHDLNHPFLTGGKALVLSFGQQFFFGPVEDLLNNNVLEDAYQHHFTYFSHPKSGCPVIMAD